MNRQNFDIAGGFPLETDTLDQMQKAYSLLNALGEIAGDKAILKGCTVNARGELSDGVVYVGGEVLEFRGGVQQDTVVIKEDKTNKVFEDGEAHEVLCERYMAFGSGEGALKWKDFTRHGSLKQAIGSEALTAVHPKLDLLYFSAVKNAVGCVSITLEGVLTEYDSTYGFMQLFTLPEEFRPYGFVTPVSCCVSLAYNKASWVAVPYESRTVGIAVDGSVQLYDYERDPNTQGRHISFSTNYMI